MGCYRYCNHRLWKVNECSVHDDKHPCQLDANRGVVRVLSREVLAYAGTKVLGAGFKVFPKDLAFSWSDLT